MPLPALQPGDKMHLFTEELGIINGLYEGPWIAGLHKFKSVAGDSCCGGLEEMEAGHHPKGKAKWA